MDLKVFTLKLMKGINAFYAASKVKIKEKKYELYTNYYTSF